MSRLILSDFKLLDDWAAELKRMWKGDVYSILHVGSSAKSDTDKPWRDVDVRIVVSDMEHDLIAAHIDVLRLNFLLSLWGRQVTGLPIDCQLQTLTESSTEHRDKWRNSLGLRAQITGATQ